MLAPDYGSISELDSSINFPSAQKLLNNEDAFEYMDAKVEMPDRFKGMILLSIHKRVTHCDDQRKYLHIFFAKWYVKANRKIEKTIDWILTRSTISKCSFVYRIKVTAKQGRKALKRCASNSKGKTLKIQDPRQAQPESKNLEAINTVQPESKKNFEAISTLQKIFDSNSRESSKSVESRNQVPIAGSKSKLQASAYVYKVLQGFASRRLLAGFQKIEDNLTDQNLVIELAKARRNLELVEVNFQIETEIQQMNSGYDEQMERFDKITNSLSALKANMDLKKSQGLTQALKKLVYPEMLQFFCLLKETFGKCLEQSPDDRFQVEEVGSSLQSIDSMDSRGKYEKKQFNSSSFRSQEGI